MSFTVEDKNTIRHLVINVGSLFGVMVILILLALFVGG